MRNRYLHIFRGLLFYMFCLCSIMIEAQNTRNYRTNSRQMQVEMNTHLSTIDSIANVCYQEVTAIHKDVADLRSEVDTLSYNTCSYINDKIKEPNWDKKSANRSFWSIIAMIVIFLITFWQTQRQIKSQHKDTIEKLAAEREHSQAQIKSQRQNTDRHIKTQQNMTRQQISEMQKQSNARLNSLQEMGNRIEGFTGKIQKSVEHFEKTIIGKDDKKLIDDLISEVKVINEDLYQKLKSDYSYFVPNSNHKDKYFDSVYKIKTDLDRIVNILKAYVSADQIPDAGPYIDALQKIAIGLSLSDMDLGFSNLGKKYLDQLSSVTKTVFCNINSTNIQTS